MKKRMPIVVAYDISDKKIWRKVYNTVKAWRLDGQLSVHECRLTETQAQELFVDVMQRVNQLAAQPEFYDTLTNNCTTNIVQHINRLRPGRVPYDLRILLPGFSDKLAYDLGLLKVDTSFEAARRRARVDRLAGQYDDHPDFSEKIRRR